MLESSDPGPSGMDPSFTLYLMEKSRLISSMYFCGLGVITWNFPDSFLFIVFISKCHCFRTLLINIKQGHKLPDVSKNISWPKNIYYWVQLAPPLPSAEEEEEWACICSKATLAPPVVLA